MKQKNHCVLLKNIIKEECYIYLKSYNKTGLNLIKSTFNWQLNILGIFNLVWIGMYLKVLSMFYFKNRRIIRNTFVVNPFNSQLVFRWCNILEKGIYYN